MQKKLARKGKKLEKEENLEEGIVGGKWRK